MLDQKSIVACMIAKSEPGDPFCLVANQLPGQDSNLEKQDQNLV
jgi:hypothetical protein